MESSGGGAGTTRSASPLAWLLVTGVAVIDLCVAALVALPLRQGLQQQRTATLVSAGNLARLLDDDLTAALDKVDLALHATSDEHRRQLEEGRVDGRALEALLERELARAPDLVGLRTADSSGVIQHGVPRSEAGVGVSLADREFFAPLQADASLGPFVTKPYVGRISGRPVLAIVRRLSSPGGGFAGVVVGSVALDRISALISTLDVGPHGSVSVRFRDMSLVARTGPAGANTGFGNTLVSPELRRIVEAALAVGTYDARAGADGFERSFAFRKLPRYPLYVLVGLAPADYLAGWRRQAEVAGGLVVLFSLGTIIGAWFVHRGWRQRLQYEQLRGLAEEALAQEKERLAVTLRSIGDGVIATDLEQRVVLVNSAAERLTGWTMAEAEGRPITEVFRIVDPETSVPVESPIARALASGRIVELTHHTTLLGRGGRSYVIADSSSPIRDRESRVIGAVLVFRDITAQERAEEELARVQKVESLAVLAGGIAHDFNNLLANIVGNISYAREAVAGQPAVAEALADAEGASLRARALTQQLLTFARGGAPVKKRVDLGKLVEETARFAGHGSGTACQFGLAPGLEAVVDEGQIGQVVQNLVLNGIHAMASGGTLRIDGESCELPAENPFLLQPGRYVRLTVEDHGSGIPPEVLPRIFDPFFTTKAEGNGLGLSICHSIVRKHEGHIEVSSRPGDGTTFHVYLPASRGPEEHRAVAVAAGPPSPAGARRVLVMDDEEGVRTLVARALRPVGYEVVGVRDGQEALACYAESKAEGRPFAAVLMDLTIPGAMGGKEAIARLRALDPEVVAIVSSGYSTDPVMAHHLEYGFRGVLVKPYLVGDLREVLTRLLDPRGRGEHQARHVVRTASS